MRKSHHTLRLLNVSNTMTSLPDGNCSSVSLQNISAGDLYVQYATDAENVNIVKQGLSINLPVLENANEIQISSPQVTSNSVNAAYVQ